MDVIPDNIYNNINRVRSSLLLLTDREMSYVVKHPTMQLNSVFPKMVNYCKENNFELTLEYENFCSSTVKYSADNLKEAKIKFKSRTLNNEAEEEKKRASQTWVFAVKKTLDKKKEVEILNAQQNNFSIKDMKETKQRASKEVKFDVPETPTTKLLKNMKKKSLTKKSVVVAPHGSNSLLNISRGDSKTTNFSRGDSKPTKIEVVNSRPNPGVYLEDPVLFKKICDSFKFIRSLAICDAKYSKHIYESPEIKKKAEEELEKQIDDFEVSLMIKDFPDYEKAGLQKKLSKMRIQRKEMEETKSSKLGFSLKPARILKSKNSIREAGGIGQVATKHFEEKRGKKRSSTHMLNINLINTLSLFSPEKKMIVYNKDKELDIDIQLEENKDDESLILMDLSLENDNRDNFLSTNDMLLKDLKIEENKSFDMLNNSIC